MAELYPSGILTVISDDVNVKTYEAIVKGENIPEPGAESFKVLIKELQSLALDVKVLSEADEEITIEEPEDDISQAAKELGIDIGGEEEEKENEKEKDLLEDIDNLDSEDEESKTDDEDALEIDTDAEDVETYDIESEDLDEQDTFVEDEKIDDYFGFGEEDTDDFD